MLFALDARGSCESCRSSPIASSCRSTKAATSGRAASPSRCSTAPSSASRPTPASIGYGEVCPLGPFYLPAYAEGVRAGLRELGAAPARPRSARTGEAEPRMDAALKGHRLREVAASTSPAGTFSARRPACRSACCWAGALARASGSIAPSRRNRRRRWRESRGLPGRGLHALPTESRRRSRHRHRAHSRRPRAMLDADDRARRRRQHRLDAARSHARRPRGARRRRLHRAAVPDLRRMPRGAAAHRSSVRARRERSTASTCCCAPTPTWRWTSST